MQALALFRSLFLSMLKPLLAWKTKSNNKLSVSELERAFGAPLVQSAFRWNLLGDAPVSTYVLTDHEQLGSLIHPWFANEEGHVVDWAFGDVQFFIDNRPLGVLEAAQNPVSLYPCTRQKIERIATELGSFQSPVQLTVLAYALPEGKFLLLDSNHRIATVAARKLPFRIILFAVHGPMDPEILTDLLHFHPEVVSKGGGVSKLVRQVNEAKAWEQTYAVIADC